jgi:uncharacterized protein (DUF2062 family)
MPAATKITKSLHGLLSSGLTPQKMAFTVALGVSLGILPIFWGTTLLCAFAAFALGLNQPAIQVVNYMSCPLQIMLLLPFYRLGERILPSSTPTPVFGNSGHLMGTLSHMGISTLKAIIAWLLVAPLLALLLYLVLVPVFKRKFPNTATKYAAGC